MIKTLKWFLIVTLTFALIGIAWFWTPDTDFDQTLQRYTQGQTQFVELEDGTRIHYSDKGARSGTTLLLVHGTSDSLITWNKITPLLQDEYRLISFDLPGHGFSSAPEKPSFEHFVSTGSKLLDHLSVERAIWVGNSLGGGIAWRAGLFQAEQVEALVLLDPSGAPRTSEPRSNIGFKILANPVGRFFGLHLTPRALIEKSLQGSVADPTLATHDLVDRYWELLRLPGNREALANLASLRRSDSAWDDIGNVTAPTLIIWGTEDQITPTENAAKFESAMQNAELRIYEGVAHLPMQEAPERVAADIKSFISNLNRGSPDSE